MSSLTKKGSDTHDHKYTKKAFKHVPIYSTVQDNGKVNRNTQAGKDKILFNICACGHMVAYDMERTVM